MASFFVNPFLWPFLALAAAPLILHLLSRRRLPNVPLPTFRFLFDTYVRQRRRLKLLEYLILLLRTLFLLFLALALMRPLQGKLPSWLGGAGRTATLVVDCSASMGAGAAGVSSLERAKQAAAATLKRLDPADRVTLVRMDERPEAVASNFAANAPELAAALQRLKPGLGGAAAHAALSAALGGERAGGRARTAYFFTDLQRTAWEPLLAQRETLPFAGDDRAVVVHVGSKEGFPNHGIVGSAPEGRDAIVGQPIELRPRLGNFGPAPWDAVLRVEIDGAEIARLAVPVPPGRTTERMVPFVPTKPGVLKGRFVVERDGFDLDDEFLFALNVAPPARVLLVNGRPESDPFKDELVFLRAALTARGVDAGAGGVSAASLALEEVRDGEWTAERLAGVAAVVFANAQTFHNEQQAELRQFVAAGGGALFFPGDRVHNRLHELLARRGTALTPLLPVQMEDARGDPNRRDKFERLAAVDYGHPALSVFRPQGDRQFLAAPRFFRYHALALDRAARGAQALAEFGNHLPALVEAKFGKGTAILAAFPVSAEWSTLPLTGGDFVPLMLRLVGHVRRRPELQVLPPARPGSVAAVAVADTLEQPVATVVGPDGLPLPVALRPANGEQAGKIDATNVRGHYTVELDAREAAPPRREGQPAPPERRFHAAAGFAVNVAPEESDLRPATKEEVEAALGERGRVVDLAGAEGDLEEELTRQRELWRWLAWALLALFFGEFFLATLRGPRTAAEQAADAAKGDWATRLTGVQAMDEEPHA